MKNIHIYVLLCQKKKKQTYARYIPHLKHLMVPHFTGCYLWLGQMNLR